MRLKTLCACLTLVTYAGIAMEPPSDGEMRSAGKGKAPAENRSGPIDLANLKNISKEELLREMARLSQENTDLQQKVKKHDDKVIEEDDSLEPHTGNKSPLERLDEYLQNSRNLSLSDLKFVYDHLSKEGFTCTIFLEGEKFKLEGKAYKSKKAAKDAIAEYVYNVLKRRARNGEASSSGANQPPSSNSRKEEKTDSKEKSNLEYDSSFISDSLEDSKSSGSGDSSSSSPTSSDSESSGSGDSSSGSSTSSDYESSGSGDSSSSSWTFSDYESSGSGDSSSSSWTFSDYESSGSGDSSSSSPTSSDSESSGSDDSSSNESYISVIIYEPGNGSPSLRSESSHSSTSFDSYDSNGTVIMAPERLSDNYDSDKTLGEN